jgi:hypothetical protein
MVDRELYYVGSGWLATAPGPTQACDDKRVGRASVCTLVEIFCRCEQGKARCVVLACFPRRVFIAKEDAWRPDATFLITDREMS